MRDTQIIFLGQELQTLVGWTIADMCFTDENTGWLQIQKNGDTKTVELIGVDGEFTIFSKI